MSRRRVLAGLGGALASGVAAACTPKDGPVSVPLAQLAGGARVRVLVRTEPVEVRREGDQVIATRLTCTHLGCEVKWSLAQRIYTCPCHKSHFDEAGRVMEGPPTQPLARLPVRIEAGAAIVEG